MAEPGEGIGEEALDLRLLADVARADPERIRLVDLGRRLCPDGRYTRDVDGVQVRSDGLHLTPEGVRARIAPWLLPQLLASAA